MDIDSETGEIKLRAMTAAHDCGRAINPLSVQGQLEGSVSNGLGQACYEERLLDGGQTLNPSFLSYKIPTVLEVSPIRNLLIETIDPEVPFGAKEAGEGTQLSTVPAIANAIFNASGARIKELPITAEKIWQASLK